MSFSSFLLPLTPIVDPLLWTKKLIPLLSLTDLARSRPINSQFEKHWQDNLDRIKVIRIPQDIENINFLVPIYDIVRQRTKQQVEPLVVILDEGSHIIDQGPHSTYFRKGRGETDNVLTFNQHYSSNNFDLIIVGKGREKTKVIGGLCTHIENGKLVLKDLTLSGSNGDGVAGEERCFFGVENVLIEGCAGRAAIGVLNLGTFHNVKVRNCAGGLYSTCGSIFLLSGPQTEVHHNHGPGLVPQADGNDGVIQIVSPLTLEMVSHDNNPNCYHGGSIHIVEAGSGDDPYSHKTIKTVYDGRENEIDY